MNSDIPRGLELSIKAKLKANEDRLYQRWLVEKGHYKDKSLNDDFNKVLDMLYPKKVQKTDINKAKARLDAEADRITRKLVKK